MKPAEREVYIGKLMKDKKLAEDLRYAAVVENGKASRLFRLMISFAAIEKEGMAPAGAGRYFGAKRLV